MNEIKFLENFRYSKIFCLKGIYFFIVSSLIFYVQRDNVLCIQSLWDNRVASSSSNYCLQKNKILNAFVWITANPFSLSFVMIFNPINILWDTLCVVYVGRMKKNKTFKRLQRTSKKWWWHVQTFELYIQLSFFYIITWTLI